MPTPYDPALRVQRRAIDAVRISLLAELARQQDVAAEAAAIDVRITHEASIVNDDWRLSAPAYRQRQRLRRRELDEEQARIEPLLGRLRDAGMEASGQLQALTGAAGAFIAERLRQEAAADQARADDLAGARTVAARGQPVKARR